MSNKYDELNEEGTLSNNDNNECKQRCWKVITIYLMVMTTIIVIAIILVDIILNTFIIPCTNVSLVIFIPSLVIFCIFRLIAIILSNKYNTKNKYLILECPNGDRLYSYILIYLYLPFECLGTILLIYSLFFSNKNSDCYRKWNNQTIILMIFRSIWVIILLIQGTKDCFYYA